jgi:hypothetical protein
MSLKWVEVFMMGRWAMVTPMNIQPVRTLEEMRRFVEGTEGVEFEVEGKDARDRRTEDALRRFRYRELGKADGGTIRRFIERVSGLSRAQATRLIHQYLECARVRRCQRIVRGFPRRYTATPRPTSGCLPSSMSCTPPSRAPRRRSSASGPCLFGDERYGRLAGAPSSSPGSPSTSSMA